MSYEYVGHILTIYIFGEIVKIYTPENRVQGIVSYYTNLYRVQKNNLMREVFASN
jgi:uncharacterized membrane-anchored protein YitT (DUF2179 family)